jgi:hypothetical protein
MILGGVALLDGAALAAVAGVGAFALFAGGVDWIIEAVWHLTDSIAF